MIYLSDDYLCKYCDCLSYLIARSAEERYSFSYIERTLSYSKVLSELEKSNVTLIAFSSMESIYLDTFPKIDNKGFILDIYGEYGWIGNIYMHLFLDLEITFESLFFIVPIQEMLGLYHLYHEMSYSQMLDYVKNKVKYSILDVIMKEKKISAKELSNKTLISLSTIKALRYGKRDITKLEAKILLIIANYLDIKMESLLPRIYLKKSI